MKKKKFSKKLIFIIILLIPFSFFLGFEINNISIDRYNFNEYERAKVILDTLPQEGINFYNIKEFNKIYGLDIKPIKNCYVINSNNGDYPYIFAFKLESFFYRLKYKNRYFAHYEYNWESRIICSGCLIVKSCKNKGNKTYCDDANLAGFRVTISNPCR